jgi:hypothetical protein
VVAAVLVPVLGTAFLLLYFFPGDTDRLFAWTIRPPMTPMLMGAAYGAGAYFWTRVFFTSEWHRIAVVFVATTVFTLLNGIATVIHWDRFHHDNVTFWIWAVVYFVTPVLVPLTYFLNAPRDTRRPEEPVLMPPTLRLLMGASGVAGVALATVMFFSPSTIIPDFPWALTPLTARVIAAWLAFFGFGWLSMARDARWSAWQLTMESSLIALCLILIGVVRDWDSFDDSAIETWLFVGVALGYLAVVVYSFAYAASARRQSVTVEAAAG